MMDIIFLPLIQTPIDSCPRIAAEAAAKAKRGCLVGNAPLAAMIAAIGFAQVTAKESGDRLDIFL